MNFLTLTSRVGGRMTMFLLIVSLVATACGGGTTTTSTTTEAPPAVAFVTDAEADTTTTSAVEMMTVRVAARNSIASSPVWIADSLGFFANHGIDIEFVPVTDEEAVVATLLSGEANLGLTSSTSMIQGNRSTRRETIRPEVYIDGTDVEGSAKRGSLSLVIPDGSPIVGGCDLEGATVSVDSLTSVSAVAVREMMIRAECDPAKVNLVALLGDETIAGLRGGQLDAAATLDPLTTQLLRGPNVLGANLDVEICPAFGRCPLALAVARIAWADSNPEIVEAFRNAMHDSMTWIRGNELQYRAELVRCCSVNADDAAGVQIPNFVGDRRDLDSDMARLRSVVVAQIERRQLADEAAEAAAEDGSGEGETSEEVADS